MLLMKLFLIFFLLILHILSIISLYLNIIAHEGKHNDFPGLNESFELNLLPTADKRQDFRLLKALLGVN